MHPVLFELPLPRLGLPLGQTLAVVASLALLATLVGFRRRSFELLATGGVCMAAAAFGAFWFRADKLVVGPIPVPAFGLLLALSLALGTVLTLRYAARTTLARERVIAACVAAGTAGILGARAAYALLHPHELAELGRLFAFRDGGMSAYGGLAFGIGGAWLALGRRTESLLVWLDAAALGLGLGVTFTRIGCWLEGCDFGRPLGAAAPGLLRALGTFPAGSRAWVEQVISQRVSPAAPSALPVHPAELYEALGGGFLVVLVLVLTRRQRVPGQTALAGLAGYALLRVLVDIFRDTSADVWAARVLAIPIALLAVAFWARLIPASRPA